MRISPINTKIQKTSFGLKDAYGSYWTEGKYIATDSQKSPKEYKTHNSDETLIEPETSAPENTVLCIFS